MMNGLSILSIMEKNNNQKNDFTHCRSLIDMELNVILTRKVKKKIHKIEFFYTFQFFGTLCCISIYPFAGFRAF